MAHITIKRVYEAPSSDDGLRVLVDRLWPRGLKRATSRIDLWMKDVAPSTELRAWFGHDVSRWAVFKRRYKAELRKNPRLVQELRKAVASTKTVTLLFGAKDEQHNNAVVLREFLLD